MRPLGRAKWIGPAVLFAGILSMSADPAAAEPASTDTVIAGFRLERKNVFDPAVPGEDWWPFLTADRIHILTVERVVRRELLLRPGEPWDPLKALETERNLRSLGFIRRAELRPVRRPDGRTDVKVTTQDSWTLIPRLSIGTSGGENYLAGGVEERNLFGRGKGARYLHSREGGELRNEVRYTDPRLLNSWHRLSTLYANTTKGNEHGVLLQRPFYSLDAEHAAKLSWARVIRENVLYRDAEEVSKFDHDFRSVRALFGRRVSPERSQLTQRLSAGYHYEKSRFMSTADTAAGTLPERRTITGPLFGYELVQQRYIKETGVDTTHRVEDFNLGNEFRLLGGPMLDALGSDRDRWIFTAVDQQGLSLGRGRFLITRGGVEGRMARRERLENALFFGNLGVYWKTRFPFPQTWAGHAEITSGRSLDGERQVVLGGSTGLPGYKNDSFAGGRSILFNLEDRFFLDREFFHLFYLGGAVFADSGAVAPKEAPAALNRFRFKTDIGFGLRVSPSRSTTGRVVRIDLAYALNDGPGRDRWVVSVRSGQPFSLFGTASERALRSPDDVLDDSPPH